MLIDDVRRVALLLPEVIEGAHMGNPDLRVGGKIFATLWVDEDGVVVKLTPEVQAVLTEAEPSVFEPISGSWGRRGWTNVDLVEADAETLRSALIATWRTVAHQGSYPSILWPNQERGQSVFDQNRGPG